ncbi:transcription elongation factor GreAB [Rhizobium puerariae]|uniref:Transcription elongation factor GreAB n=1 Tax=Rhizobium puerariae TaxID=1585791 RepID=A0ABV6AF60_9HYPH
MAMEPHFHLTAKDHSLLQTILERHQGTYGPYLKLLERKVRDSAIYLRDDIPPNVVTVNTRFVYVADGVRTGSHLIVEGEAADLPSFALSVHTLEGLALLGLAEKSSIDIEIGPGVHQTLQIEYIVSQPEAQARTYAPLNGPIRRNAPDVSGNVISFRPRPVRATPGSRLDPDDDPGPSAA